METNTPEPHELSPRTRRLVLNLVLMAMLVVTVVVLAIRLGPDAGAAPDRAVPRSAAMEKLTGVRVSRVAVVGDGGLVTVFYVVIDPEKATQFQADRDHPPRLRSEARDEGTQRASIMRAGHQMRAGQTYYLVYQNSGEALRSGETMSLTYGGVTLRHVPVL